MAVQHGHAAGELTGADMKADKKYLTQVTRQDLSEMADAANSYGGDGIDVKRTQDGLEISIDKAQFTRWVRILMNGGKLQ